VDMYAALVRRQKRIFRVGTRVIVAKHLDEKFLNRDLYVCGKEVEGKGDSKHLVLLLGIKRGKRIIPKGIRATVFENGACPIQVIRWNPDAWKGGLYVDGQSSKRKSRVVKKRH